MNRATDPDASAGGVLVSGFDAFGDHDRNPSAEIAWRLHGSATSSGRPIQAIGLPTVFGACRERLRQAIAERRPMVVIALGLAASRREIGVERIAVNLDDARIADNAGCQPIDQPVVPGAPAAYFSTLPVKAIVQALRANGHPAEVSSSAGHFVCNHLFYGLAHDIATCWPALRGGFIHLPPWHLEGEAGMSRLLDAVTLAIDVAVRGPAAAFEAGASGIARGEGRID